MALELRCPVCKWMGYDEVLEEFEPGALQGLPIWLMCPICCLSIPYPVATHCISIAQAKRKLAGANSPQGNENLECRRLYTHPEDCPQCRFALVCDRWVEHQARLAKLTQKEWEQLEFQRWRMAKGDFNDNLGGE